MWWDAANGLTKAAPPRSAETAITVNAPVCASLSSSGSSATHGMHQVAQKFSTTGRPAKSASVLRPPSSVPNVAGGSTAGGLAATIAESGIMST